MAQIRTVTTLERKRKQIAASIKLYERQLAQARLDLAHVEATVRIFAASGKPADIARYVDTYRLFKRGERGPSVLRRRPNVVPSTVLAKRLTNRLIHSLRMQEHHGRVRRDGKHKGVTKSSEIPILDPYSLRDEQCRSHVHPTNSSVSTNKKTAAIETIATLRNTKAR